jgi:hypothetical protein
VHDMQKNQPSNDWILEFLYTFKQFSMTPYLNF